MALPSIRTSLDAGSTGQSLILTVYTLVFALVLLPAGRLGDEYGHKKVFFVGVAIFAAAGTWCGLAPNVTQLVLGQALAGVGGGLFVGPNTNASFVQTEGLDAGVASALATTAQRCGTAVGIGLLLALFSSLPGGPTELDNQAVAAFITAGFAAAAALLMIATRRSNLDTSTR